MTRVEKLDLKRRKQVRNETIKGLRRAVFQFLYRSASGLPFGDGDRPRVDANLRALASMAPVLVDLLRPVRRRKTT